MQAPKRDRPRSIEYNLRAEEVLQRFLHEGMPDTTAWAQAETFSDSVRILFRDVVDSCQTLLDSAVMYSPQSHLYYAWYHQAADRYRALDTLSQADKVNYALALALAGEKEQARKAIDSLIKDTPAREQLLRALENPQGTLDEFLP